MKFKALIVLLSASLMFGSCGEDCTLTTLDEIIIGSWDVIALGQNTGTIEFLADGTLIDPDDALIGGEINGTVLDEKTYEVLSSTQFNARAAKGTSFVDADFDVTSFDCDDIIIDLFGFDVNLKRN
jgi:hypothetical protein